MEAGLLVIGVLVVIVGLSVFFGAPYVPTRRQDIKQLFDELYPLTSSDVVLDIGSGDGVVLREASRRGARAVGYEIHPLFVAISKLLSRNDPRTTIKFTNAWREPFPKEVTLVYAFSVGRDVRRLADKVQFETNRLKRPITFVCYGNPLPNRQVDMQRGAFNLYRFEPLHQ